MKEFHKLIKRIGEELGIKITLLSDDWTIVLEKDNRIHYITGYQFEPWHYRYVGLDVAKYIYEHDITFEELKLNDDSSFIGKSLVESNFRKTYGVTIVAIKRADGEFITNPSFDLIFEKGDILVVIANAAEVHKLENSSDFNLVNGKNLEN